MIKTFITSIVLAIMLTGSAFAEQAYQKDIQLFDQREIVLENNTLTKGKLTTIKEAVAELGELKEVRVIYDSTVSKARRTIFLLMCLATAQVL